MSHVNITLELSSHKVSIHIFRAVLCTKRRVSYAGKAVNCRLGSAFRAPKQWAVGLTWSACHDVQQTLHRAAAEQYTTPRGAPAHENNQWNTSSQSTSAIFEIVIHCPHQTM
jgi:hypothetical protein